jgi:hypothetical protein
MGACDALKGGMCSSAYYAFAFSGAGYGAPRFQTARKSWYAIIKEHLVQN